jgi:hypothetical protein
MIGLCQARAKALLTRFGGARVQILSDFFAACVGLSAVVPVPYSQNQTSGRANYWLCQWKRLCVIFPRHHI